MALKPKQENLATKINGYRARVMGLNGVSSDIAGNFTVLPEIEQKMETKIRESSDFLAKISNVPVRDLQGKKVGMTSSTTIAGRTNTDNAERVTQSTLSLDESEYKCEKTDFDTHINHNTLDVWSSQPGFQKRITQTVIEQIARDRIMIGFNGTSVAPDTDRAANPLLQDVNIGWLEQIRIHRAESVMTGTKIGAGGGFVNLDAAVYAARHEFMEAHHATSTDIVAIMGTGLVIDKNISTMEDFEAPSERAANQMLMTKQMIGTLQPYFVPFLPARSIMLTSFKNLAIYFQKGSRRRHIIDNPKRDRLEDYQSSNEAYIVEDFGKVALLDNLLFKNKVTDAWE